MNPVQIEQDFLKTLFEGDETETSINGYELTLSEDGAVYVKKIDELVL